MAVTLAPVLCSLLFHHKAEETDTFIDRLMKRRYLKALSRVLRHRYLTVGVMVLADGLHRDPGSPTWG